MNTPHRLLLAQVVAHLSVIPMIIWAEWWMWAVSFGVYFATGCLGMTMTYHRLLSHRSWNCPKWLERTFALFATIGLTGSALGWVAIHRKHHRFTDQPEDPHAPKWIGFWRAHFLSMYCKVELRYVKDLLRSRFYQFQHQYYFAINGVYALLLFLVDPMAVVYAWLFPAMILWNAGSSVLSYSHRNGAPHNDRWLGWIVWGEGWHQNHHDKTSSPMFHPTQDVGWIIIKNIDKKAGN